MLATTSPLGTPARSASHTPSGNDTSTSAATCIASLVLPAPPVPVIVHNRLASSRSTSWAISSRRPMNRVSCTGRLWGRLSSDRSGGKSAAKAGCFELVEPVRLGQVGEPMDAEIEQLRPGGEAGHGERPGCLGHEHLTAVPGPAHRLRGSRRDRERGILRSCRPLDVDPHSHPHRRQPGWCRLEGLLGGHRGADGLGRDRATRPPRCPRRCSAASRRSRYRSQPALAGSGPSPTDTAPVTAAATGSTPPHRCTAATPRWTRAPRSGPPATRNGRPPDRRDRTVARPSRSQLPAARRRARTAPRRREGGRRAARRWPATRPFFPPGRRRGAAPPDARPGRDSRRHAARPRRCAPPPGRAARGSRATVPPPPADATPTPRAPPPKPRRTPPTNVSPPPDPTSRPPWRSTISATTSSRRSTAAAITSLLRVPQHGGVGHVNRHERDHPAGQRLEPTGTQPLGQLTSRPRPPGRVGRQPPAKGPRQRAHLRRVDPLPQRTGAIRRATCQQRHRRRRQPVDVGGRRQPALGGHLRGDVARGSPPAAAPVPPTRSRSRPA